MTEGTTMFAILIGYKITILLAGVLMAYLGYRLFMADKIAPAGNLAASAGTYKLDLRGSAPGIFFCLFGTVLICVSLTGATKFQWDPDPPAKEAAVNAAPR
jgi:hypothetical protein